MKTGNYKINKTLIFKILLPAAIVILLIISSGTLFFNQKIEKQLIERDDIIKELSDDYNNIKSKYDILVMENTQEPCKIAHSPTLRSNQLIVTKDNRFNLKKGDRIQITYETGLTKVSMEFFVFDISQNKKDNTEADFIISTKNLNFLVSQKKLSRGIYDMYLKKITMQYN